MKSMRKVRKGDEEGEVFDLLSRYKTLGILHDIIVDLVVFHTHQLGDEDELG